MASEASSSAAAGPPRSASSPAISGLGLLGLAAALLACALLQPPAALRPWICLLATALPMLVWAVGVERAQRDPAAGLDLEHPRPAREALRTTAVKVVGLWATWALIAAAYWLLDAFHTPANLRTFRWAAYVLPVALPLSVVYLAWVDRRMREPRDELWEAGALVLRLPGPRDRAKLAHHARAWLVKGFFLVFMLAVLPGAVVAATTQPWAQLAADPARLALWAVGLMFTFDVCFGTVGYLCAVKALGTHIRTADPYLSGWTAALICYPPLVLMGPGGPINYTAATRGWISWTSGNDALITAWGVMLTLLAGAYAWSTAVFGLRFSNLTHRGIITSGPYRWFRHPAYLSKNLFWWLSVLPFLVTEGGATQALRNCGLLLLVNAVYWWRGRTEERHLLADPVYRDYRAWTEAHGPMPRARRAVAAALVRKPPKAGPERV